ncbi:condensation domain-containing protein, partial [Pantoea sp. SIMBA_072]
NDASATKFDLYLEVTDLDGRLGCCLTYSRDLFDEPRIARMAEHWQQLLVSLLDNPQQRLCELPMLSSAEQQVLAGQLQGEQDFDLDQTLHGLFAAQAA